MHMPVRIERRFLLQRIVFRKSLEIFGNFHFSIDKQSFLCYTASVLLHIVHLYAVLEHSGKEILWSGLIYLIL